MLTILLGIVIYFIGAICKYLHDDYKQYPNIHVGYKTKSAMKDKYSWEEANSYFYKICTLSLIFSVGFIGIINLIDLQVVRSVYTITRLLVVFGPIALIEIHLYKFNRYKGMNNQ